MAQSRGQEEQRYSLQETKSLPIQVTSHTERLGILTTFDQEDFKISRIETAVFLKLPMEQWL